MRNVDSYFISVVEEEQTTTIRVCLGCGEKIGGTHRCWCRYYPQEKCIYQTQTGDDPTKYRVIY